MLDFAKSITTFLALNIVMIFTFWLGLQFQAFRLREFQLRRILLKALVLNLFVIPLLAIVIVQAVPASPLGAMVIVLFAISPGVPFMVLGPQRKFVPPAASIALSLILTLSAVVALPVWLLVIERMFRSLAVDGIGNIARSLALNIFIPFFLGWAILLAFPGIARRLQWPVGIIFKAALVVVLVLLIVVSLPAWPRIAPNSILAMLLVTVASVICGDWAGRPALGDRTMLASSATNGNPAIALAVLQASFPDLKTYAPGIAVYLLLRMGSTKLYALWVEKFRVERGDSYANSNIRHPSNVT